MFAAIGSGRCRNLRISGIAISVIAPTTGPLKLPVPPMMTMLSMRIDSSSVKDVGSI